MKRDMRKAEEKNWKERPTSLLQSGNQRKNKNYCKFVIYNNVLLNMCRSWNKKIDLLNVERKNKIN